MMGRKASQSIRGSIWASLSPSLWIFRYSFRRVKDVKESMVEGWCCRAKRLT